MASGRERCADCGWPLNEHAVIGIEAKQGRRKASLKCVLTMTMRPRPGMEDYVRQGLREKHGLAIEPPAPPPARSPETPPTRVPGATVTVPDDHSADLAALAEDCERRVAKAEAEARVFTEQLELAEAERDAMKAERDRLKADLIDKERRCIIADARIEENEKLRARNSELERVSGALEERMRWLESNPAQSSGPLPAAADSCVHQGCVESVCLTLTAVLSDAEPIVKGCCQDPKHRHELFVKVRASAAETLGAAQAAPQEAT